MFLTNKVNVQETEVGTVFLVDTVDKCTYKMVVDVDNEINEDRKIIHLSMLDSEENETFQGDVIIKNIEINVPLLWVKFPLEIQLIYNTNSRVSPVQKIEVYTD